MKQNKLVTNIALSAMFLSLGLVLPFLTGQIPTLGTLLLPMHIPVLLCGFICGKQYGLTVGFVLPLFRSALFSAPVMYPMAISMAFELACYGFLSGFLFSRAKWQCVRSLYRCLIITMLVGRVVFGIAQFILLNASGTGFTFSQFISAAFVNAIPGIILQLVVIPALMLALKRTHLMHFKSHNTKEE